MSAVHINVDHYPKPVGKISARIHGAQRAMTERATLALEASTQATDERQAAALRGKAAAYREAAAAIAALENGTRLPARRVPMCGPRTEDDDA